MGIFGFCFPPLIRQGQSRQSSARGATRSSTTRTSEIGGRVFNGEPGRVISVMTGLLEMKFWSKHEIIDCKTAQLQSGTSKLNLIIPFHGKDGGCRWFFPCQSKSTGDSSAHHHTCQPFAARQLSWPWSSGLLCDGRPLEGRLVHRWRGEVVVKSERTFGGLLTIGIKFYLYRWIVLISQEGGDPLDRVWQSQFWDAEDEIRFVENPSISPPFLLSVALTKMGQHPAFPGSSASSPPQAPTAATTCHGQCAATDRVPS